MNEIAELIDKIEDKIRRTWKEASGGDGDWTLATFKILESVGEEYAFKSRYTNTAEDNHELLWDFVWIDNSFEDFNSIPLVAESEWTYKNVMEDFNKLLAASSPIRLMIFQTQSWDNYESMLKIFKNRSKRYATNPGIYISACWDYSQREPYFETWHTHFTKKT